MWRPKALPTTWPRAPSLCLLFTVTKSTRNTRLWAGWARGEPLSQTEQQDTLAFVRGEKVLQRCRETIAVHARRAISAWSELPRNIFTLGLHDLLAFICACSWGGMPPQLDGLIDLNVPPDPQE